MGFPLNSVKKDFMQNSNELVGYYRTKYKNLSSVKASKSVLFFKVDHPRPSLSFSQENGNLLKAHRWVC